MMNRTIWQLGAGAVVAGCVAGVATAAPAAAASTTMALWHMDDKTQTMADSSGHSYSTTLSGVAIQQPGYSGTAFGFTRKPAYVRVASSGNLQPGSSAFAVTLHVKFSTRPSSTVGDYDLLRKGLSTTSGGSYKVEILGTGKAYCNFRGSHEIGLTAGPNLADNRWHTVSCRQALTSIKLTVDGVTYTKSGSTGSIANTDSLIIAAKNTSGSDQYNGLLDEISITKG